MTSQARGASVASSSAENRSRVDQPARYAGTLESSASFHPDSGLAVALALLQHSKLIPMSNDGHIDIHPGALSLAIRYERDGDETFAIATNSERGSGFVDALEGRLHLGR